MQDAQRSCTKATQEANRRLILTKPVAIMDNFPITLLMTILALILVLVLAWFAIRLLARMGGKTRGGNRISITQTVMIGSREKLMLVQCNDREYFLGVTSSSISLLDENSAPTAELQPAIRPNNDRSTLEG